jgi:predicted permease
MRVALGAGRGRLVQQLLTESLVLGGAGALAGLGLAALAFLLLRRLTLPVPLPVELQFTLDWRLTLLTLGLIVATTCLAGLAPAMQTSRAALGPAIKLHERRFLRRVTLRGLLVTGQVTISLLLLIAALTFVRNLARASTVDPGFDVDRVLVAQVSFVEGRQGTADRPAAEAMAERARELPGVAGAAISEGVPLTIFAGRRTGTEVRIDGRDGLVRVDYDGMLVGPGYFETMGIRLLRGRDFTAADRPQAAPVVIINEEFALRYFPGLDPLGRRIADAYGSRPAQEVVGIVSNGKYHSLAESQDAAIYDPMLQMASPGRFVHLLVRTRGAPDTVAPVLRQAILAADDSAAVTLTPMRNALAFALLPSQIGSALLGLLGALGTGLAMVGLFGVVSFTVSRRTAEIAVRSALGASRRAVLLLVMRDAARLVGGGVAVGLPLAWFVLSPLAAFLVVGVTPLDPSSVAGAVVLLACASLAAVWGPARRALGISPSVALRLE